MERRKFIVNTAIASIATVGMAKAFAAEPLKSTEKKFYNHYLLFWLKKDLTPKQVEDFVQFFKDLSKLPYLKSIHYGTPANSSPRAVLDNSFSYNVVMTFESLEDLETYGKLPEHLATVKKYSIFWDKMQVHDSVLI
ncbi:Dabb family protein [Flavobacterium psychroterrae]|uniref:Dabb family protein n=1 Tax=Flavobacterium psychroterrae TaxID=2133767 RepID=A0ABS5P584_9FLAO|nr:Dabb family protein [Flavobacterium psychroterrae]MBS7229440.1 Dabb family protein [Flavobacterium psychroterrae]